MWSFHYLLPPFECFETEKKHKFMKFEFRSGCSSQLRTQHPHTRGQWKRQQQHRNYFQTKGHVADGWSCPPRTHTHTMATRKRDVALMSWIFWKSDFCCFRFNDGKKPKSNIKDKPHTMKQRLFPSHKWFIHWFFGRKIEHKTHWFATKFDPLFFGFR